jgi:hypothetical protein
MLPLEQPVRTAAAETARAESITAIRRLEALDTFFLFTFQIRRRVYTHSRCAIQCAQRRPQTHLD